jgi:hypothetical protein
MKAIKKLSVGSDNFFGDSALEFFGQFGIDPRTRTGEWRLTRRSLDSESQIRSGD